MGEKTQGALWLQFDKLCWAAKLVMPGTSLSAISTSRW